MHLAKALLASAVLTLVAAAAHAVPIKVEHVTGGNLDLPWTYGFGVPNSMYGKTLDASDPAYANPSGDHTVAVAQNASPDSGGICLTVTDPGAVADYAWGAEFFTGNGETRRGIVVRADPSNQFMSCYQLVVEQGLFQIKFRKLVNGAPTTLGSWFSTVLPAGSIAPNTWHELKIVAHGANFYCYFDGYDLTQGTPIVDGDLATGWVGAYNFRFDLGNVPVYFDDLILDSDVLTATHPVSWGKLQSQYR